MHTVNSIIQGKTTKQAFYISKKIQWLYFSKAAFIDIGILLEYFPNPAATSPTLENIAMQYILLAGINTSPKPNESEDQLPKCPKNLPFPPTKANINRLKD